MDNEKLNNEEELEVAEEVAEEIEEAIEEEIEEAVAEEIAELEEELEAVEEIAELEEELEAVEELEDALEAVEALEPKKSGKGAMIALIAAGAVVLAAAVAYLLLYFGVVNPYEEGYIDITGVTLEEVADKSGYSLSEYKKVNGLPMLMPKSTNENAVQNNMKLGSVIAQSGMPFDQFKEFYGWGDNITEDVTVGEALGETTLKYMFGLGQLEEEEAKTQFETLKEQYELGKNVKLDTKYKEVRIHMDTKSKELRAEQEKAQKEAEKKAEEAEKTDKTEETEAEAE